MASIVVRIDGRFTELSPETKGKGTYYLDYYDPTVTRGSLKGCVKSQGRRHLQ